MLGSRRAAIPSVVLLDGDDLVVGEAAALRASGEPSRVAREFKRRVGDPVPILVGGVPMAAETLMARTLARVVEQVTATEGAPPDALAVTHPANWGEYKLDLFRQAIRQAGVEVTHLVPEPVAAASFYAAQRRPAPGSLVAVYDLGGGTFDAAVVRVDDAGFTVLGRPEGIERLGGIDFDHAVFGHVVRSLDLDLDRLGEDGPSAALAALRRDCVEAKEALSGETDVAIPVMLPGRHTQVRLTRAELEAMISPALAETVEVLRRAVASAQVQADDLTTVLLVGGSSRIPLVAQLVTAGLRRPIAADARPKDAIPLGAALLTTPTTPPAPTSPAADRSGGDPEPAALTTSDAVGPPPVQPQRPGSTPTSSRRRRLLVAGGIAVVAAVVVAAIVTRDDSSGGDDRSPPPGAYDPAVEGPIAEAFQLDGTALTVGWKDQPEAQLLGEITREALTAAGADVTTRSAPVTSDALHEGLTGGDVDLYWDYLADIWRRSLDQSDAPSADADTLLADLDGLDADDGVSWLAPTDFDAAGTLVVNGDLAAGLGLTTMSDLGAAIEEVDATGDDVTLCAARDPADLVSAVEDAYDVSLPAWELVEAGELYDRVQAGACTLGVGVATDAALAELDVMALPDDRAALAAANAALGVRSAVLDAHPDVERLFAAVAGDLDDRTMQALNARVQVEGEAPRTVARGWLAERGFLDEPAGGGAPLAPIADSYDLSGASFVVGAEDTTLGSVLGELTRQALAVAGAEARVETYAADTDQARAAVLAGQADLYWESLAGAWVEHLGHTVLDADLATLYERVRDEDAGNGVAWLEPAAFDRSWAVVATREAAAELDVDSVEDLGQLEGLAADQETPFVCGTINDTPRSWIEETYGFDLPGYEVVDGDVEGLVDSGGCHFGVVRATSPWLDSLGLTLLADDAGAMPEDAMAVAASDTVTTSHPELAELVAVLGTALDGDAIRAITARVEVDRVETETAVGDWLRDTGLVTG
jgi:molecular chaperone DnaK